MCRSDRSLHFNLSRLMKKQGSLPKRIITDKLSSYGAARRQVVPRVEHRSHKGLNNRAENSYLPLRKRERMMQGFRSVGACAQLTQVRPRHPPSPSANHGGMESRGGRARLKTSQASLLRPL